MVRVTLLGRAASEVFRDNPADADATGALVDRVLDDHADVQA